MKKILIVFLILISTSCMTKGEEVTCTIGGKTAVFELKNGIISNYTFDGDKVDQAQVDELNGTYFTSSTNNEEGKEVLNSYVSSLNGNCE